MSTFGALNTAFRGLTAARQGMNVAGQNIANAATEGYTRQRVEQSSLAAPAQGLFGINTPAAGQGVSVDAIARLGSSVLDGGVRSTGAQAGYAGARSTALQGIEGVLQEPGDNGISASLQEFWAGWQGAANQPGEPAPAGVLLAAANTLAGKISNAYTSLETQWQSTLGQAKDAVTTVNAAATQVAAYNTTIRSTVAAGGSANELIDARAKLTETIARLAGGTVREQADGTVDVHVGGNALVTGSTARAFALSGGTPEALGASVQLEWADRPGAAIPVSAGQIAGALTVLASADKGGVIASAAASFDAFAANLAAVVNTVHSTGQSPDGARLQPFFDTTGGSAAKNLRVVPQTTDAIAVGNPASGPKDGSIADKIAQLGVGTDSPDAMWQRTVARIGVDSRGAQQHEALATAAETSALNSRASSASVSLDEENISLLTNQHAFQAAARVMTAVDEALDVLINRTGLVGR